MKKVTYIIMGIVLLVGSITTGSYGLSDEDKEIYEMALEQQEEINAIGFQQFVLSDYPVVFFDGSHDYVMHQEESGYSIEKREPVLNTFAGTAYEVNGHYEVIVPTVDKIGKLFDMADSVENIQGFMDGAETSFQESGYGEKEQVAIIWHEAFHAYQMTNEGEQIKNLLAGHTFSEEDLGQKLIVEQIDENEEQKKLYKQQLALLKKALNVTEVDTLEEIILQYKMLEEERTASLSEEVRILESYYKQIEGSAYYIESIIYRNLHSEEAFQTRYIENLDGYQNGSAKYYTIGMAECMILDKLCDDWESEYDFSKSFMEMICEELNVIRSR